LVISIRPRRATSLALGVALVAACGSSGTPAPSATTSLTIGLGYIASVQFAQFYVADQRGYYRAAGLDVTFQQQSDPDLVRLVGQGAVDLAIADGTSVIPAVSQGIPIRYVATIYAKFPNVVFAPADAGIETAADLEGRRLGIPFRFGSSWIMLQALLSSVDLTPEDLTIVEYPDFGQLAAVQEGAIEAATGFVNNEPVQLAQGGDEPVVLRVDDIVPLPGNGLIIGEGTLAAERDAATAFVAATLRAMDDIIADPEAGLAAAIVAVPELAADREDQLEVLEATIDTWQSDLTEREGLGAIDPTAWTASIDYMASLSGDLVPNPVTADQLITTELLP
jgi:NitT/TauT family transport system substrate-binding protein